MIAALLPSRLTNRLRLALTAAAAVVLPCLLLTWPAGAAGVVPGELDPSFGADGVSSYQLGGGTAAQSQVNAMVVQPDGKILLAGSGTDSRGNPAFLVARLGSNGILDTTFGDAGRLLVQLGALGAGDSPPSSEATALSLQPDGKILVGGDASPGTVGFLLARLTPEGRFDSSFGSGGRVSDPQETDPEFGTPSIGVSAIGLQPDGKIVVAGSTFFYHGGSVLTARINSNGSFDQKFGDGGEVFYSYQTGGAREFNEAHALALQPDGKIVIAGLTGTDNGISFLATRLNGSDGSLDSSFGKQGAVIYDAFDPECADRFGAGYGVALQPDGKIVTAGATAGSPECGASTERAPTLVTRMNGVDGSFDPGFGTAGKSLADLGAGAEPQASLQAVALQPDGRIVVAGFVSDSNSKNQVLIARLNEDGSFDPSFAIDGKYLHQFGGRDATSEIRAIALQPDGNILAAGGAASETLILRLTGDGTPGAGQPHGLPQHLPGGGPGPAKVAVVSSLGMSPPAFAAAGRGGSIARRTGTTVSYRDNLAATTTFTVLKPARGVRRGRQCLKPRRGRPGKSCTRYAAVGGFRRRDTAGLNSFHFTGRVRHRKLAPGRYRLQAVPHFAGKNGRAKTTGFRITR